MIYEPQISIEMIHDQFVTRYACSDYRY